MQQPAAGFDVIDVFIVALYARNVIDDLEGLCDPVTDVNVLKDIRKCHHCKACGPYDLRYDRYRDHIDGLISLGSKLASLVWRSARFP